MEAIALSHVSFSYPNTDSPALQDVSLSLEQGEFATLFGSSGCGKTTLLRLLKPSLSPTGRLDGKISLAGSPVCTYSLRAQSEKIGFVQQSPDSQIVTDKVWHELAFGLESLGLPSAEIRTRVAEVASFLGISPWFYQSTDTLSGGQKQLLSLASVLVMQPDILLLDEPTSQLDPIAASGFLGAVKRINQELGVTVLLSEHRLEDALPLSDKAFVLEKGRLIADGPPHRVGELLRHRGCGIYASMPTPMRIWSALGDPSPCPATVSEGRVWLEKRCREIPPVPLPPDLPPLSKSSENSIPALSFRDVWFRHEPSQSDVLRGLNFSVFKEEICAIVGGNGAGKSTLLSVACGLLTPCRGTVSLFGKEFPTERKREDGMQGWAMLPQDPQALFTGASLSEEFFHILQSSGLSEDEKSKQVKSIARLCGLSPFLARHPFDLSGGEQQRAALACVLLTRPKLLLLDEPTKGLDAEHKQIFGEILKKLQNSGVTTLLVSHDIEFCARWVDRCAMLFDGQIVSDAAPRAFFSGNRFYTTAANRMARRVIPDAISAEDVIFACGGTPPSAPPSDNNGDYSFLTPSPAQERKSESFSTRVQKKLSFRQKVGLGFSALFLLTAALFYGPLKNAGNPLLSFLLIGELMLSIGLLFSGFSKLPPDLSLPDETRKRSRRALLPLFLLIPAALITAGAGIFLLNDRKYYFISLLIILEAIACFLMMFEKRAPRAREMAVLSVLCGLSAAGRAAFFMLPQFKPCLALVILSGVCLGGESGFLVGASAALLSNMALGQGPWTPWQMFALGAAGLLAGVLFHRGPLPKRRGLLCIFGILAAFLYGALMNPASVLMVQHHPTREMILSACALGLPFDALHAAATAFFLWFLSYPVIRTLRRVQIKYGMMENP